MNDLLFDVGYGHFLVLAAVLFLIGVAGVLIRRNALIILMSVELLLSAATMTLLPLLASAINLIFGKRSGKPGAGVLAVLAVAGACVLAGVEVFGGLFYHATKEAPPLWQAGGITQTAWSWLEVGGFKAELAFRLDSLSAVMILIITFVGTWIHIYSMGYMA